MYSLRHFYPFINSLRRFI